MPANLLIFDADYVSELTAKMNTACELMAEAVSSLKSASNHENWKCKERTKITEDFEELNIRLDRLDNGVNEVTRILGGSVSRFSSLENQYESQADNLHDELTNNHGFRATVHTGDSTPEGGSSSENNGKESGTANTVGAAGAGALGASAGQAVSSSGEGGQSNGRRGRGSAGVSAFRIPGIGRMPNHRTDTNTDTNSAANTGTVSGGGTGGSSMNVNLPVTHIPDNPGAAAKGVKDTQEIANAALNSVVEAMTEALGTQSADSNTDLGATAARLADTYNAGRNIFESCSVIIANPSQPHTSERLAMAAGLVRLAGNSGTVQSSGSMANSGSASLSQNAGRISSALQGNSEASELVSLLGALTGTDSGSGSSGGNSQSFFDMIIEALKKELSGSGQNNSVSSSSKTTLASSSPVMEFLGNFVMDQAV